MTVTCVHIKVKPEYLEDFIKISLENHQGTRTTEAGNLRFDFLQEKEDPCSFLLYEVFESEEAVRLHKETAHYQAWRDTVNPMMAERRYGVHYLPLAPKDQKLW